MSPGSQVACKLKVNRRQSRKQVGYHERKRTYYNLSLMEGFKGQKQCIPASFLIVFMCGSGERR